MISFIRSPLRSLFPPVTAPPVATDRIALLPDADRSDQPTPWASTAGHGPPPCAAAVVGSAWHHTLTTLTMRTSRTSGRTSNWALKRPSRNPHCLQR